MTLLAPLARTAPLGFAAALATSTAACGADDSLGTGTLEVVVTGEDAAKTGFPFEEDGERIALADDWTIVFSQVLLSIGELEVTGSGGDTAVASTDRWIVDLHAGDPSLGRYGGLPARRWEQLGFVIPRAATGARLGDAVSTAAGEQMIAAGATHLLTGTATRGSTSVGFELVLVNPTRSSSCTNGADGKQGVVIANGGAAEVEITIHLDHLFWDSLGSEEARLRFDAWAGADALGDADGRVTTDELALQPLSDLKGADGTSPLGVVYDSGSVPLAAQHLGAFVGASASSMAHLNGDGLCTISAL
ncbi:MAG: hypothetical protein IT376_13345 [Polyangiaceae bacterium]|nr:hypothetical protein [Polyangiaceae bacterium]